MAITFGTIYRDITSRLSDVGISQQQFMRKDLVNAINDAVRQLQMDYVNNGIAEDLVVTETVTPTTKDTSYPFLYSETLQKPIMQDMPVSMVLYESVVEVADEIPDASDTFSAGDLKIKDGKLYKAVTDGSSVNAFDLTFEAEKVRNYYDNNGLTFNVGDIVLNQSDGTYWRCTSEYTNDQGETISASGSFEQVYWMEIGEAHAEVMPLKVKSLFQAKLKSDLHQSYPIAIKQDTLYVVEPNVSYFLSYVPEWEDIEDFSVDMDVPETMIPSIKDQAIQRLAVKLQVDIQTTEQENE